MSILTYYHSTNGMILSGTHCIECSMFTLVTSELCQASSILKGLNNLYLPSTSYSTDDNFPKLN